MAQKYWLADNGTVRCLDDRCPQECDMQCPIYLNTIALECLQADDFNEAGTYLEKAVKIEPTFGEAWNNLAACYGQMGRHQDAYEAYLKSYNLNPKSHAVYGMAVTMKNLGNYSQATQYTSLYVHKYGEDIYVLNENYRNTLQITEYCNKEFDAEIFPIGINSEEVKHMNLDSAVQWLSQIRKNNPDFRIALIVKKDDNALRSAVDSVFSKNDISWFAVDDRKVSVLTVENAKGLEFDAVAVVCKNMMINELYIAYTRALDNLCIVKDNL